LLVQHTREPKKKPQEGDTNGNSVKTTPVPQYENNLQNLNFFYMSKCTGE